MSENLYHENQEILSLVRNLILNRNKENFEILKNKMEAYDSKLNKSISDLKFNVIEDEKNISFTPIATYKDLFETGLLIENRKHFINKLGSLELPTKSILIWGKNKLGKTPLFKYWKEILDNEFLKLKTKEIIDFESGVENWNKIKEKKKYSNLFYKETDLLKLILNKKLDSINITSRYLFLDDLCDPKIFGDYTNFKYNDYIIAFTEFYENLRELVYQNKIIVIGNSNVFPTSEVLGKNTKLQSRFVSCFESIIEV